MRLTSRGIDEYTLAAYLAGRLAPARHREVADFLARDEDARDLLVAANQLLESEGDGQPSRPPTLSSVDLPPRSKPLLSGSRRLSVMLWTTVSLVCLTAFVTTILVAFRVGLDAGAADAAAAQVDQSRMVSVTGPFGSLSWVGDPDAAYYRIVVWDVSTQRTVGEVESDVPYLDYQSLEGFLREAGPRRVWIDAHDADGRMLNRTRSISIGS